MRCGRDAERHRQDPDDLHRGLDSTGGKQQRHQHGNRAAARTRSGGEADARWQTAANAGTHVDPLTGQAVSNSNGSDEADAPVTVPAGLAGYRSSHLTAILAPLAVVLLILALVLPPVVAYRMSAKRRGAG